MTYATYQWVPDKFCAGKHFLCAFPLHTSNIRCFLLATAQCREHVKELYVDILTTRNCRCRNHNSNNNGHPTTLQCHVSSLTSMHWLGVTPANSNALESDVAENSHFFTKDYWDWQPKYIRFHNKQEPNVPVAQGYQKLKKYVFAWSFLKLPDL